MKLKTFIVAATVLLTSANITAAGYQTIVATPYDGDPVKINISDALNTTVDGGDMVFGDAAGAKRIALTNLKSVAFSNEGTTGIENLDASTEEVTVEAGRVVLGNLPVGSHVAVFALDGRTVLSAIAEGSYVIDLDAFEAGVYVINFNNRSLKIAVK